MYTYVYITFAMQPEESSIFCWHARALSLSSTHNTHNTHVHTKLSPLPCGLKTAAHFAGAAQFATTNDFVSIVSSVVIACGEFSSKLTVDIIHLRCLFLSHFQKMRK